MNNETPLDKNSAQNFTHQFTEGKSLCRVFSARGYNLENTL